MPKANQTTRISYKDLHVTGKNKLAVSTLTRNNSTLFGTQMRPHHKHQLEQKNLKI